MSAAAPAASATSAPPAKSKKKLILIIAISIIIAAAGGGAAAYFLAGKQKAHAAKGESKDKAKGEGESTDEKGEAAEAEGDSHAESKRDPHKKPTFVAFESFTINLNDQDQERYAQIVFAIETADAATGELVKLQMPAIRGRVLMTLSSKSAKELMGRPGKELLAQDILADAKAVLGLSPKSKSLVDVHFSHFVIQ